MVKFQDLAQRLPTFSGVAILAGHIETTVWASGLGISLRLRPRGHMGKQQKSYCAADEESRNHSAHELFKIEYRYEVDARSTKQLIRRYGRTAAKTKLPPASSDAASKSANGEHVVRKASVHG